MFTLKEVDVNKNVVFWEEAESKGEGLMIFFSSRLRGNRNGRDADRKQQPSKGLCSDTARARHSHRQVSALLE